MKRIASLALGLLVGAACDSTDGGGGVSPAPEGKPYDTLAQWHLFTDAAGQVPAEGVVPVATISPLFTDYADKHRFVWLPEGKTIGYRDDGVWDLPVGAIAVKSFAYPYDLGDPGKGERVVETRLLVHESSGWVAHTYVWNEAGTEARRKIAGQFVNVSFLDEAGATQTMRYIVPTNAECQECHGKAPSTFPLGLKSAQLDHDGQIERLTEAGYFASAPTIAAEHFAAPDSDASLELRARSYLDANCAHCHSSKGDANSKGLYLDFASTDPAQPATNWGVCKVPTSAGGATCGNVYDVVPGDADHSVLICRMLSTQGSEQMPPIGRGQVHTEGVALLREWINAMPRAACSPDE